MQQKPGTVHATPEYQYLPHQIEIHKTPETELHLDNIKREDGFCLWKPLIYSLKVHRKPPL
jgi:hypothetical protein